MKPSIIDAVRCPRCAAALDFRSHEIVCRGCARPYPRLGGLPILMADAEAYLHSCRKQLALFDHQAARTVQSIETELRFPDVLPATRARCHAMIEAIRGQAEDIHSILQTLQSDPEPTSEEYSAFLTYLHYLYRDWGWPPEPNGENERTLALVDKVLDHRPIGHMLVLGAGACRLAYDLHRRDPSAETIVLDIDPLLFTAAQSVIRGGSVGIREANAEIDEIAHTSRHWILRAPSGAIDETRFHFMLADGLHPPFAPATMDTVVTPWFIDIVPADLRNFLGVVRRLLKPGGRWLNLGPLRYKQETPVRLRFGREELFDLATRAGFRIDNWKRESMPYLVSKLNGRGKVECVLGFAATKVEVAPGGSPPDWLLFPDIPIPQFSGQSLSWTEDPAEQIVIASIDGCNTVNDIASILESKASETGLTRDQFCEIVRRCLGVIHPDAVPRDNTNSD